MNSPKVREAMRIVSKQLRAMDPAELRRQIDTHRGGPLSRQLIDSGMFEAREAEAAELLPAGPAVAVPRGPLVFSSETAALWSNVRDWSNPHVTSWFTNHYVAAYAAVDWSSLRSQAEHSIAWLKGGTALIESLIDLHFDYHAVKLPLGSLERQTKMQTFVVSFSDDIEDYGWAA